MVDIQAARAKLARAAIRRALYSVWPKPMGPGLIAEAIPEDLACTGETLERALYYLRDRGHVETAGALPMGGSLYRLSADGVDRVESDADFGADRARGARMLRLRVLQALDLGRPQPMGLSLISIALAEDTDLDLSEPSIRRALAYLADRDLAAPQGEAWRIRGDGIDYLAGDGEGIAGVARPLGW
jgi:hypothetical protein